MEKFIEFLQHEIAFREQWIDYLKSQGKVTETVFYAGERSAFIQVLYRLTTACTGLPGQPAPEADKPDIPASQ